MDIQILDIWFFKSKPDHDFHYSKYQIYGYPNPDRSGIQFRTSIVGSTFMVSQGIVRTKR